MIYLLSCVQLFGNPWTVAHQTHLSMGFSRQEYVVGCHSLLQGIFQTQGLNLGPVFAVGFFTTSTTWEASLVTQLVKNLPAMWGTQVQSLGQEDPLE